jgi:hypothetical protein
VSPYIPFSRHPAIHGRDWLRRAYAMFGAYRVTWLLLLVAYYALTVLVQFVPLIGPLAWVLLKPVFSVGFLAAAWSQERGEAPRVAHLFRGFQANLWALMPLGAVFVAGVTVALLASALVDGGTLIGMATGKVPITEEAFASGQVEMAMLFSAICALPVILALWFAPALVVFNDAGTVTALVTSLRACLANWRAVLVYGALVVLFAVVVPSALGVLMRLLPAAMAKAATIVVVMPYLLVFMATMHVSDYVSYRDIFHADEPTDREPPASAG